MYWAVDEATGKEINTVAFAVTRPLDQRWLSLALVAVDLPSDCCDFARHALTTLFGAQRARGQGASTRSATTVRKGSTVMETLSKERGASGGETSDPDSQGARATVLVIDDSTMVLKFIRRGLTEQGHVVEITDSGSSGIELARSGRFDVVVCDLHMPEIDGRAVIREIAAIDPDLPVVILSAESDLSAVLTVIHIGAFDYVLKSQDVGPLTAAVGRAVLHRRLILSNRRLSRELAATNQELASRLAELEDAMAKLRRSDSQLRQANLDLEAARDEALRANQSKSHFLASMSHELRTPLNAIIGYSELVGEELGDVGGEELLPDVERIGHAGRHLLQLLNDILDLSKVEAGKMEVYLETASTASIISYVVDTIQPVVAKSGNALVVKTDDAVESMHTDVTKVRQLLFNLLSNACKFTDHGTVTLEADSETVDGRAWARFRVSDTGIGLTRDQIGKLFQPFIQAEAGTSRKYGGTGLGLALCDRFCRMLGGDISVTSEPGEGSTFTVRLPVSADPKA